MKRIYSLLPLLIQSLISISQTPQWQLVGNSTGDNSNEGYAVAVDSFNNVYCGGSFSSSDFHFGPFALENTALNTYFVAKMAPDGTVLWVSSAGNASFNECIDMAVDADNNLMVIGRYSGDSITLGTITLYNDAGDNFFIAKYSPDGEVLWAKTPTALLGYAHGGSINCDVYGNTYVTGDFGSPEIIFDTYTLTNNGSSDYFVVKYDADGNTLWALNGGGNAADYGMAIASDVAGGVYVAGNFYSPVIHLGAYTVTNAGQADVFVAKYSSDGDPGWITSGYGPALDQATALAVPVSGNTVYLTGYFNDNYMVFGNDTINNTAPGAFPNADIFITKYDASGSVIWAKGAGGVGDDRCFDMTCNTEGHIFLTGGYSFPTPEAVAWFDTLGLYSTADDVDPLFLVQYDENGNVYCGNTLISGSDDRLGLAIDTGNTAYICTDYFTEPFPVGYDTLMLDGAFENVFVAKYNCEVVTHDTVTTAVYPIGLNKIRIYPNPASTEITIACSVTNGTLNIYSMHGELMESKIISSSNGIIQVNVQNFPAGIYCCSLTGMGNNFNFTSTFTIVR